MFNFNRCITLPNPHFTDKLSPGVGGKQFNRFRVKFLRRMVTRCEIIDDQGNVVADQVVLKPGEEDNHHFGLLMALKSTFKYLEPLYSSAVLQQLYDHFSNGGRWEPSMVKAFDSTGHVMDVNKLREANLRDKERWDEEMSAARALHFTKGYTQGANDAKANLEGEMISIRENRNTYRAMFIILCVLDILQYVGGPHYLTKAFHYIFG